MQEFRWASTFSGNPSSSLPASAVSMMQPDLAMQRRRSHCDRVHFSSKSNCVTGQSRYSLYYLFDVHADYFLRTSLCSSISPFSGARYWVALAGRLYWHDRWLRGLAPEAGRCLRWFKAVFNGIPAQPIRVTGCSLRSFATDRNSLHPARRN